MPSEINDITIIIRSAHERTEYLCRKLILDQNVREEDVFLIHEVPFSMAMKRSFEIGLQQKKTWTFCIDADVLMRPGSIKQMIGFAEEQKRNVCEIQGFVADKFFGGIRQAGNHLYRTSLLKKVIGRIPDEGTDIRPERYTLGKMMDDGYPWVVVPFIVGTHDDEQYYFDIYRKAFVHAKKHLKRAELLVNNWTENCGEDFDFKVALKGFADGIYNHEEVFINSELPLYREQFSKAGFEEKKPLQENEFSLETIEHQIQNWKYHEMYSSYFPNRDGFDGKTKASVEKLKRNFKTHGTIGTLRLISSSFLLYLSDKIRKKL